MTALRELAERWKAEAAQWMIRGEDVPQTLDACADELLAILDAEGDGGAVAWMAEDDAALSARMSGRMGGMHDGTRLMSFKELKQGDYRHVFPLYTHPARSGVVRDEDVEACVVAMKEANAAQWNATKDVTWSHGMRAALEHFAKGERHER